MLPTLAAIWGSWPRLPGRRDSCSAWSASMPWRTWGATTAKTSPLARRSVKNGHRSIYYSNRPACRSWGLKPQCTGGGVRRIERCEGEAVLDRMAERLAARPEILATRREMVEHSFGSTADGSVLRRSASPDPLSSGWPKVGFGGRSIPARVRMTAAQRDQTVSRSRPQWLARPLAPSRPASAPGRGREWCRSGRTAPHRARCRSLRRSETACSCRWPPGSC
jgi:hypothetical protein